MTKSGERFIDYYKNGECTLEAMQIVYNKGHITKEEFRETTGREPIIKTQEIITEEQQLLSSV